MKFLCLILSTILFSTAYSQKIITDVELRGLKGKVKSVGNLASPYSNFLMEFDNQGMFSKIWSAGGCNTDEDYENINIRKRSMKYKVKDLGGSNFCSSRFFALQKIFNFKGRNYIQYDLKYNFEKVKGAEENNNFTIVTINKTVNGKFAGRSIYHLDSKLRRIMIIIIDEKLNFSSSRYIYDNENFHPTSVENSNEKNKFTKIMYSYSQIDKKGNWLKRTEKTINLQNEKSSEYVNERAIGYYE